MKFALRADLLDFTADPGFAAPAEAPGVRFRPDHWLLVGDDGRIADVRSEAPGDDWLRVEQHAGRLLMPGFIDTHVHSPQLDVIASYGTELLDWLETYTFPAERRHESAEVARAEAAAFLDALVAHGTTAAVVYPTVHKASAEALFEAAEDRFMRVVAGKVLMDRNAPEFLRDRDVPTAERECRELIEAWHGRSRLAYAVTVRFAPTSTPAQLAMAGRLIEEVPGLYLQTHVAENRDEVAWVASLFPEARSYLDVYHRHGLLNERAVLAHGIWLDDTDRALLAETGAQISFCPSSNLFLGSGLFGWRAVEAAGGRVSIGSDVGGGTSLSMHRTLGDGYKVQALAGTRLTAWKALHAATLGAASHLGLAHEIGRLEPGCFADLAVWDWAHGPVATHRHARAKELHEKVFAWMTLSDDRALAAAYVAGVARHARGVPRAEGQ